MLAYKLCAYVHTLPPIFQGELSDLQTITVLGLLVNLAHDTAAFRIQMGKLGSFEVLDIVGHIAAAVAQREKNIANSLFPGATFSALDAVPFHRAAPPLPVQGQDAHRPDQPGHPPGGHLQTGGTT